MTIHEFGKGNEKSILLIHPSVVKWDYFEYVILSDGTLWEVQTAL